MMKTGSCLLKEEVKLFRSVTRVSNKEYRRNGCEMDRFFLKWFCPNIYALIAYSHGEGRLTNSDLFRTYQPILIEFTMVVYEKIYLAA